MPIELSCTSCHAVNAFLDDQAGSMGRCGQCQAALYIPRQDEMPSSWPLHPVGDKRGYDRLAWIAIGTIGLCGIVACSVLAFVVINNYYIAAEPSHQASATPTQALPKGTGSEAKGKETSKETKGTAKDPLDLAATVTLETSKPAIHEGWIKQAGDETVLKFKAPAAGLVAVYFDAKDSPKLMGRLMAFDADRKQIANNDADADQRISLLQFRVGAGQEYYVKAGAFDGDTGKFQVKLLHLPRIGNTFDSALELRLTAKGALVQPGKLDSNGDEHMFRFVAPVTGWMIADFSPGPGSVLDGHLLAFSDTHERLNSHAMNQAFPVAQGKSYFINVASWASPLEGKSRTGTYNLTLRTETSAAKEIVLDSAGAASLLDALKTPKDCVFYTFKSTTTANLKIGLEGTAGTVFDGYLFAFDANRKPVGSGQKTQAIDLPATAGNTYYIQVAPHQFAAGNVAPGSYQLKIGMSQPPPITGPVIAHLDLDASGSTKVANTIAQPGGIASYKFQAKQTGLMVVQFQRPPGSKLDAFLTCATDKLSNFGFNSGDLCAFMATAGQTYVVKLTAHTFPLPGLQGVGAFELAFRAEKSDPVVLDGTGAGKVSGEILPGALKSFLIEPKQNGLMVIQFQRPAGSKLDPELTGLAANHTSFNAGNRTEREFVVTAGQSFIVMVSGSKYPLPGLQGVGTFDLVFKTETIPPDDYGNTLATAFDVALKDDAAVLKGRIEVPDDVDCFKVKAPHDGWLTVNVTVPSGSKLDMKFTVCDQNGMPIALPYVAVEKDQYYYVKVESWRPALDGLRSTGEYSASLKFAKILPDDFGNDFVTAHDIFVNKSLSSFQMGRIEVSDDVDFFRFKAAATGTVEIALEADMGNKLKTHLFVYDMDQKLLKDAQEGARRIAQVQVQEGATYYIKVAAKKDGAAGEMRGCYRLEIRPLNQAGAGSTPGKAINGELLLDKKGKLSETDPSYTSMDPPEAFKTLALLTKDHPHKVFTIKFKKGEQVIIRLLSDDFDPVLVLEDANKKVLAFNDDDPVAMNLNSRIDFTATSDGEFRIVCMALGPPVRNQLIGGFQLTVHRALTGAADKSGKLP